MPLTQDQVLQYVQQNGPCVPNDIRQALKAQDNFVVGAILSELANAGKLKMTDMSLGTSRFYFDPNQPQTLEKVGHHLNEKDVRAFQLLQAERVVKNSELTPILRVSMAAIRDFSRPLKVRTDEGEELFWYYYLLSAEEAFELTKKKFLGEPERRLEPPTVEQKFPEKAPEPKPVEKKPRTVKPKAPPVLQTALPTQPALTDGFAKQLHEYFESKQISVLQLLSNKKTEVDCIVALPSGVGALHYYCKAKAKKTTSEGDLASALLESQQHKLPLLYVAGGTLTKKAQELLTTQLRGVAVVAPWA
jgi:hypothetical protein